MDVTTVLFFILSRKKGRKQTPSIIIKRLHNSTHTYMYVNAHFVHSFKSINGTPESKKRICVKKTKKKKRAVHEETLSERLVRKGSIGLNASFTLANSLHRRLLHFLLEGKKRRGTLFSGATFFLLIIVSSTIFFLPLPLSCTTFFMETSMLLFSLSLFSFLRSF